MAKGQLNLLETRARARGAHAAPQSNSKNVEFFIETITPDMAREYLSKRLHGRNGDDRAATAYSEAMRNGAWIVNGMPIVFDRDGTLLDGVVRLEACLIANVPFTTLVARNVRRDTLHTIDQHRRRSYHGVLESRGERNAGAMIRTMGKLIRLENGILGLEQGQISWSRYDQVLDANPLIRSAVQKSLDADKTHLNSTSRHVLFFQALSAGQDKELRSFVSALSEPELYPINHPGSVLAQQIQIYKTATEGMYDVEVALAQAVLAFEAMKAGDTSNRGFAWKPDFGKAKLNDAGRPMNRAERAKAPRNLGMPTVDGYPGIEAALFDPQNKEEMAGPLAQSLRAGASTHDGITIEAMTVTPEIAADWLANYNTRNRKLQPNHVNNIVRDILAGNWMFNAQPICFGLDGRLLNGQHRLYACIQADTPIEVVVVHGLSDAAFVTYDIHAKKTVALTGSKDDKSDPRVLAAAAKIQWRIDNEVSAVATAVKPTAAELQETLEAHPKIGEGFSRARKLGKIGSAAVMTFLIYHARRQRPEIADAFFDGLETGEGLQKGNPLLRVRNGLQENRKQDKRQDRLATLLEAWENYKKYRDKTDSQLL